MDWEDGKGGNSHSGSNYFYLFLIFKLIFIASLSLFTWKMWAGKTEEENPTRDQTSLVVVFLINF